MPTIHDKASQMPEKCTNDLMVGDDLEAYVREICGEENRYEHDYVEPEYFDLPEPEFGEAWVCRKCGHGYKADQEDGEPVELVHLHPRP